MYAMFDTCKSLTSLSLSTLDTSNVKSFAGMFFNCIKLKSIDLSNIVTSKVENMVALFQDCHKLTSLDITHFITSLVKNMELMFNNCKSLTSLNLSSFDTSKVDNMKQMFYNCHKLTSLDLSNFNINGNNMMEEMFFNCSLLKFLNLENAVPNDLENSRIFDMVNDNVIIYSNDIKWKGLFNGVVININCMNNENENIEKKCIAKNINQENSELFCLICGDFYEQKNNDPLNNESFINCYQKSKVGNLETTELLIVTTNVFIVDNIKSINSIDSFESTIETELMTIKDYINYLLNNFNKSEIDNGNDFEIKKGNILYTLTSTNNQKNFDNNKTIIILGNCEIELKHKYNISNNDSLYITKLDINIEGMKIPKIEYAVYYPFYNETLDQLNLSFCQGMKIDLYIPAYINEDFEKYDPKSSYYNDICSISSSDNTIDIPLFDRQNLFIDINMTLCEEDCNLVDYYSTINKVQCSCGIKIKIPLLEEEIKFDKQLLKQSFTDIKNITNLKIVKCYKNVFTIKKLLKNYGFYFFLIILIIFFISFILFYARYYSILKNIIKDLIDAKNYEFKIKKNNKNIDTNNDTNNQTLNKNDNKLKKSKRFKKKKGKNKRKNHKGNNDVQAESKKSLKLNRNDNRTIHNRINVHNNKKINKKRKNKIIIHKDDDKNKKKYEEILKLNDNELNSFDYKEAIIFDKRTYSQYYLSLLKTNHLLIFSFYCNKKDYNSSIIKFLLFFFIFSVHFTVNALFFNDDTMHKIFIDNGAFNFIYQIPQIIYSSLISIIFNKPINFLSLSEKDIISIKQERKKEEFDLKVEKIYKTLKLKFLLFFISTFFLLLFFTYYITCFCGIYINTQIHLIKDSVISFGLSLVYPFAIYLIPGIFRIPALNAKNKDKECLYNISKLFHYI